MSALCIVLGFKPSRWSTVQPQCLKAEGDHFLIEIKAVLSAGLVINHGIHHQRSEPLVETHSDCIRLRAAVLELGITGEFAQPH